jgi:hypothetical protein
VAKVIHNRAAHFQFNGGMFSLFVGLVIFEVIVQNFDKAPTFWLFWAILLLHIMLSSLAVYLGSKNPALSFGVLGQGRIFIERSWMVRRERTKVIASEVACIREVLLRDSDGDTHYRFELNLKNAQTYAVAEGYQRDSTLETAQTVADWLGIAITMT